MSPCANGMSKSFFSAKSFPAAPTRVTAYRWPVSPGCLKKSSIAREKFLPIWKVLAALRHASGFVISFTASRAVKTEKELSESLRALWLKVVAAIELRNFGYAISLLQEILKQEPEFLTGRQLLRRAEVTKSKSAKKSFFNIDTATT